MTEPVEAPVLSDTASASGETSTATTSNVADVVSEAPPSFIDPETIYSKLPDAFKESGLLNDVLSDYNKRHNDALSEVQTKYSGLDDFIQEDRQKLAYGVQLVDLLNDPETARQVWENLGKAYSFMPQPQQNQMPEHQQQVQQEIPDEDLTDEQREIKALRQQVEQFGQWQQEQQRIIDQQVHTERTKIYGNEIDEALKSVFQADPGLENDHVRRGQLMQLVKAMDAEDRAVGNQPRPFSQLVSEAHAAQKEYNQHLYGIFGQQGQSRPGTSTPLVMSPTGSTPAPNTNYSEMNENQLRDAAVSKLLEAINQ